jgi:hypothetical protein
MNACERKAMLKALERNVARTKLILARLDRELEKPTPASESMYWRPKGEKPSEDARWLKDGGWSGKR